jgi:hypothetical protein
MLANLLTVNMTSFGVNARPRLFVISIVAFPSSPVRSDRLSISLDLLDIAAKHRDMTSTGLLFSSNSFRADSLKKSAVSSGIILQASAEVLAAACSAASGDGGPTKLNVKPCPRSRSIRTTSRACCGLKSMIETPVEPARPVRPDL